MRLPISRPLGCLAQSPGGTVPRGVWPLTWRPSAAEPGPEGAESWRLPAEATPRCKQVWAASLALKGSGGGVPSFHNDVYHCGTGRLEYKAHVAWDMDAYRLESD